MNEKKNLFSIIISLFFTDDAADVDLGSIHLRRLLRGDIIDRLDEPALGAAVDPSSGPGPNIPWFDILQQGLREVR